LTKLRDAALTALPTNARIRALNAATALRVDFARGWRNNQQQTSQPWPDQASRPSFTRNHTIAREPAPPIHHAPTSNCTARLMTTTNDNHPHVTASIASARSARPPIFSAMAILRRAKHQLVGAPIVKSQTCDSTRGNRFKAQIGPCWCPTPASVPLRPGSRAQAAL
jgi:hypothetical protein